MRLTPRRAGPLAFTLTAGLLASGCMTTPVQRVETLGKGQVEAAVEPGMSFYGDQLSLIPTGNVALRVGVSERADLGVRLGMTVAELTGKFMLTPRNSDLRVSLAPSISPFAMAFNGEAGGMLGAKLPVLFGVPVGDRNELVFGPSVGAIGLFDYSPLDEPAIFIPEASFSLGYSAQLGDFFRLHPELGVAWRGGPGVTELGWDKGTMVTANLGVQLGSYNRKGRKR